MSKTEKNVAIESNVTVEAAKPIEIPSSITTVSGQIRYLDSQGMKRGAIAKQLNKRYQHVRNVLITPLKKA